MNKAFTKESEGTDLPPLEEAWPLPPGVKNYMTPSGERAIREELAKKISQRGAKRDETLELRIRALERRLAEGEVVDPHKQPRDRVLFGACVRVRDEDDEERTYWIVGVDQAAPNEGRISWQSAIAKALLGKRAGDIVTVRTPGGDKELEILAIESPRD